MPDGTGAVCFGVLGTLAWDACIEERTEYRYSRKIGRAVSLMSGGVVGVRMIVLGGWCRKRTISDMVAPRRRLNTA